jgi:hypothetical protein
MTEILLTLRISRRAIGAAVLRSGELTLLDGRYLNSTPDRTVPAAIRYLDKLLKMTHATLVVVDAPGSNDPKSATFRVLAAARELFLSNGVPLVLLDRVELMRAFTVTSVVDRREARELARILWPDVLKVTGTVQPYVADAAAAAVYTECSNALRPPGP